MLTRQVGRFPYLLVAQQAHLSLGQPQHILFVSTVGAVANCADTGSQWSVNVVRCEFRPFFFMAPVAKFRSGRKQIVSFRLTGKIVAGGTTTHCDGPVYIVFLGQLLVAFQTALGDYHEVLT